MLYRSRAAGDCRIVLDIIRREILFHDTWVPIDERAGQCPEGNLLVGLHQNLLIYLSASAPASISKASAFARLAPAAKPKPPPSEYTGSEPFSPSFSLTHSALLPYDEH